MVVIIILLQGPLYFEIASLCFGVVSFLFNGHFTSAESSINKLGFIVILFFLKEQKFIATLAAP